MLQLKRCTCKCSVLCFKINFSFVMFYSVYNEERNLLRLRAWEQRNQETSQAKELNHENVPLFGEPYKVKIYIVAVKCFNYDPFGRSASDNLGSFACKQQYNFYIFDFFNKLLSFNTITLLHFKYNVWGIATKTLFKWYKQRKKRSVRCQPFKKRK